MKQKTIWIEVTRGVDRGCRGYLVSVAPPDRRPRWATVCFGDPRPIDDPRYYGYPVTWLRRLVRVP